MKKYITLLILIVGSVLSTFAQMSEVLGISIKESLSTWKSRLLEKGPGG